MIAITIPHEQRCPICGAVATPNASGKRLEIQHDFTKHSTPAVVTTPVQRPKRTAAYGDDA